MAYAYKNGVALEASMGVNFNTVSEEQIQALVDYEFRFLSFSIDGASQDSYSKYRIGGDFDRVISNIKRLQDLKKIVAQFIQNYNGNLFLTNTMKTRCFKLKLWPKKWGCLLFLS